MQGLILNIIMSISRRDPRPETRYPYPTLGLQLSISRGNRLARRYDLNLGIGYRVKTTGYPQLIKKVRNSRPPQVVYIEAAEMSFAMKGVVMGSARLFFGSSYTPARKMSSLAPTTTVLVDRYGRAHNYLRISLTERCNLRCKSVFL